MKKISIIVLSLIIVMAFASCSNTNDASQGASDDGAVPISKGYSIQNLGIDLFSEIEDLVATEGKYSSDVKINGRYTSVNVADASDDTAYIQGFYKEDLETEKVYVGGRVLGQSDLTDKIVYENDDIIVYDITSYIDGEDSAVNFELRISDSINTPQSIDKDTTTETNAELFL